MGLLDNLPFWPGAGEPERVPRPRLRRTRSWIGRQSDGTPFYRPRKKSATDTTTTDGVTNSTGLVSIEEEYVSQNYLSVTADGMVSEHYERIPGQFPSTSEAAKTVNNVSFESASAYNDRSHPARRPRRLPGLFSALRYRKLQQQGSSAELGTEGDVGGDHVEGVEEEEDGGGGDSGGTANPNPAVDPEGDTGDTQQPEEVDEGPNDPGDNSEERKVSDHTVLSQDSEGTAVTVYRHPSKRTSRPIAIVDQEYIYENPFDEVREASRLSIDPDPFPDSTRSTSDSAGPSRLECRYRPRGSSIDRPGNPVVRCFPFDSRSSSQRSSCNALSRGSDWSGHFNPHEAASAFNELATKLNLQLLSLSDDHRPSSGDEGCGPFMEEKSTRRRDRIFGRLRLMRSSLAMKVPTVPEERGLRRMKTFASFPTRAPQMVSLRGKSLVTLARLGGQSLLDLPADFVPSTLKLPVCFVSTALYLRRNAPSVRNLFFDSGDPRAAARLYDRFANQVLSAEKEGDKIEMTTRSSDMPSGFGGNIHLGTPARNATEVLTVANVFRALLAGLPGGILGSKKLYGVLVDMYYARFTDCQLERTNSCLGGLSVVDSFKTKAMTHAILALTSKMQLELICGVFGLCAVLLHETERNIEFERQARRGKVGPSFVSGLMNVDRLGRVFGPLLINNCSNNNNKDSTENEPGGGGDSYGQIEREIESERVASMLIANWRNVSRQLRSWEHGGYPSKPVVGYPAPAVRPGGVTAK